MNDIDKTKEQLISELAELRRRNAELVKTSPGEELRQARAPLGASQEILEAIVDAAPT